MSSSSQNPDARTELRNVICAQAVDDAGAEQKLDAFLAEELRTAADEIASAVPPLEAGPRTEFERGLMTAVHALRSRADELGGGVR